LRIEHGKKKKRKKEQVKAVLIELSHSARIFALLLLFSRFLCLRSIREAASHKLPDSVDQLTVLILPTV
jgi:hypothetical protein